MRLFRPTSAHGDGTWPGDKIGGRPAGVALAAWPSCAGCGGSMGLIAQLHHDAERLDLGAAGRVLTVWQCEHDPGICETWSATSGANAALVVEADATAAPPPPSDGPETTREVRIVAWTAGDDGVPDDRRADFFDDVRFAAVAQDLGDAWFDALGSDTRLGGVPTWVQGPSEAPGEPWGYVGQIGWAQDVDGEAVEGPNLGDGGIAYLFLDRTVDPPAAQMFWQCG